ncbi:hypothetical protein COLO4_37660 [Corchorus olitorius]|uniref:Uncharacterized protein n=1 Tax=Corchorus olitorius TaxID=93759 RepID=A0A1R3G0D5_9ROSI|nr:hypothetical protein COLO4_37660 [Corchorus olitorius]
MREGEKNIEWEGSRGRLLRGLESVVRPSVMKRENGDKNWVERGLCEWRFFCVLDQRVVEDDKNGREMGR